MGFDPIKDALRKAETKQKIIEAGFRVFSERTIDAANLTDVAHEAGVAMNTVYRYYNAKEPLIMDISAWMWKKYAQAGYQYLKKSGKTAAEDCAYYLDSFIDLYRNHRDMLRFNQFFNVYVQRESVSAEKMQGFLDMVDALAAQFHATYEKGKADGTLRTDIPEREMFSAMLHLMLAVVTRYAVGLVYDGGVDPEAELQFQKNLLLRAFTVDPGAN